MKRAPRSVVQVDWILFALRWLFLVGLAAYHLLNNASPLDDLDAVVVLGSGALYNVVLAALLAANQWLAILPWISLALDSALAVSAFWALGGSPQVLVWAALFPSASAAVRHQWAGGALLAAAMVAVGLALGVQYLGLDPTRYTVEALPGLVFLFTSLLLTGLVSERVRLAAIKRTHAERDTEEKRVKHMREQARAIYEMAQLVSATMNYTRVLDAALDRSTAVVGDTGSAASQMVSAVLLFRDGQLRVSTARRFTVSDQKVSLPAKRGVLAEALRQGEAAFSSEPYRDPELASIVALRNCRSLMAVPMAAGLDTFGIMLFAHPRADFFDLDHIELLEAICKHTVVALQNAKLYQKLLEEKERIVEVEEDARKKLARDLHDGPTQSVAAIAMRANYIRRLIERDPKTAQDEIYKVEDLARKTTKEIRHMLFTLRPLVLETQGLGPALQSLADKMKENYDLSVIVEAQAEAAEKLELHAQGVLFYIAEEAVGNARKHAEAEHIWVRIKLVNAGIAALEIQDDGLGFDVAAVTGSYENRGSLGMVNMRERTELVNGVLHLDSAPGKGTKVTVLVPLTDEAREKLGSV